jgi:hypothetical protein
MELGRLLALSGHAVLTGGYSGTMEAVSRGAAEAGGHVIGVTSSDLERWRPTKANPWVREERRTGTLLERLEALIQGGDAALALPGGPGTLTEIALTWNLMIVASLPPRPLILVGDGWRAVFDQFLLSLGGYAPEDQRQYLAFAPDPRTAVRLLEGRAALPGDHDE